MTFETPRVLRAARAISSYDVAGIPPTIEVPLYTAADVAAGRDSALEVAMKRMRER
jgi:hypothetical protein